MNPVDEKAVNKESLIGRYLMHPHAENIVAAIKKKEKIKLNGLIGSGFSLLAESVIRHTPGIHFVIGLDKENGAYLYNDLQNLNPKKNSSFFPASYTVPYQEEAVENGNVLMRAETLQKISASSSCVVFSHPSALSEKVIQKKELQQNTLTIVQGEDVDLDFLNEYLLQFTFEKVDYVYEPGQFSIRGGIIDIFSFANEYPYRIELFDTEVESIRLFDPVDQLSIKQMKKVSIIPNVQSQMFEENRASLFEFLPKDAVIWVDSIDILLSRLETELEKGQRVFEKLSTEVKYTPPEEMFLGPEKALQLLSNFTVIEFGHGRYFKDGSVFEFNQKFQPSFNKNFDMLWEHFAEQEKEGYTNLLLCDNPKQSERLYAIYEAQEKEINFRTVNVAVFAGFQDRDLKINAFTDHQIFERYHRFKLKEGFRKTKQALTIKELTSLEIGDYVSHIDHGVGKFSGLEKLEVNGKVQEAIRLEYSSGDMLYVSIHSLHRISKFTGKEGSTPKVNKLGTQAWAALKTKTKKRVKEVAFDLINLYAKRKTAKGYAFSPDTYLQTELEASFIYEDTPDQLTATIDVKNDMEKETPMDRLVCGDVGFGKTEIAMRAAFKAATDGKQVAILVPTTVLCLQHFKSFKKRLKDFPVTIDFTSRLKTTKENTETLKRLESGETDIIIGTHKLIGGKVKYANLGLLIIDEEQKFGVAVKDKLKTLKANLDCLTLTATPIPRTLQFSLMGARDLSIIKTPPPNRFPVQTEIKGFNEEWIRDAIMHEVERGGQVYFIHNRVQNIKEITGQLQALVPGIRICIGHGQMDPKKLEQVMIDFTDGIYDVIVATTILESGIDITNANTIIINQAQNFGLSDLHQLRGRVGRSNKKAFCYLIAPPMHHLPTLSRKRLQALEQFSDLGSGMEISMRDLDIRGAGDLLGGNQSGFMNEVGFETYSKILNEAIRELKQNEFKDLFEEENKQLGVDECVLETDLELLLPDWYVENIKERLILYKELDNLDSEEDINTFRQSLEDRFGTIPEESEELLKTIELRRTGKAIGFEKLKIKNGKMMGYFATENNQDYFQSESFGKVIQFVQKNALNAQLKDNKGKFYLVLQPCASITKAIEYLSGMIL